jgi:hypothetical protein
MKNKSIVIALILIIASAGIGTSFSIAVGAFSTNGGTDYFYDVSFLTISVSDNEANEVATEFAQIVTNNISQVTITNAYPGYIAYVDFTMANVGSDPVLLDDLTIWPYDTDALDIQVDGVIEGTFLLPREWIGGQLTIEVLESASMGSNYPFSIDIGFSGSPQ